MELRDRLPQFGLAEVRPHGGEEEELRVGGLEDQEVREPPFAACPNEQVGIRQLRPRGPEVKSARFTPDGRRILTLGYSQGEARLWNVDGSGGSVALPGAGAIVTQAIPSPDGRWVVVTTDDQSAYLFPVDLELALQALRVDNVCLSAVDRRRYLSEEKGAAQQRFEACQQRIVGDGKSR